MLSIIPTKNLRIGEKSQILGGGRDIIFIFYKDHILADEAIQNNNIN